MGRIRLKQIEDASAKSLEEAIQDTVEPGSVIRTDGWTGYDQIGSRGYIHEVVRTDAEVGDNLLPACNLVASLMKRWLGGTLQGGRLLMSILSIIWMNIHFDSIDELHGIVENFFIDYSSKQW